jgi:large subunit ribosomal protein L13e
MVKHNNIIPNGHFKKYWQRYVRTWFDQPGQKKARSLRRKARAEKMAPRPAQLVRPEVTCPTQRYNSKQRLGRGFSLAELKEAGISPAYARTVGIAVDHRRTNYSVEAKQRNVQRLKTYKSKLIVFPRRRGKLSSKKADGTTYARNQKAGDASKSDLASAPQGYAGEIMPVVRAASSIVLPMEEITDAMSEFKAYQTLRAARGQQRATGKIRFRKDEDEK